MKFDRVKQRLENIAIFQMTSVERIKKIVLNIFDKDERFFFEQNFLDIFVMTLVEDNLDEIYKTMQRNRYRQLSTLPSYERFVCFCHLIQIDSIKKVLMTKKNFKGKGLTKQLNDVRINLCAFNVPRHGKTLYDGKSHTYTREKIRERELKKFCEFIGFYTDSAGKLNLLIDAEKLKAYLCERLKGLTYETIADKISTWSSLIHGLRVEGYWIDPHVNYLFFAEMKRLLTKDIKKSEIVSGRSISRSDFEGMTVGVSEVVRLAAVLQYEYGYRASEAIDAVNHPDCVVNGRIVGISGKNGKEYLPKPIRDSDLLEELSKGHKLSKSKYYRELRKVLGTHRAHDFRVSFACNEYDRLIAEGTEEKKALLTVSFLLNHCRPEITRYYLVRR